MLIDLEQYKKSVLEKIEKKELYFDDSEFMMLKIDSDLRKTFFDLLKREPSLFTIEVVRLLERIDEYENELMEDLNLLTQYGKTLIDNGEYSIVFEIRDYVSEEEAESIANHFLELIDTNQLKGNCKYISNEVIEFVLDNKRYSFFDYVKSCNKLTDSTIAKLREYAQTVDIVPDFLAEEYEQLKIDYSKYSITGLLKIFNKRMGHDNYDNWFFPNKGQDLETDKIYRIICDKLFSGESFDIDSVKELIHSTFIEYDQENKRELIEKLIKTIGISQGIIHSIGTFFSEYENLILDAIDSKSEFGPSFGYNIDLRNSDKILQKLIDQGLLDTATSFSNFSIYIPTIIEKIKLGDPNYQNLSVECHTLIKVNLDLLKLLLDRNMIKSLSFDFYELTNRTDLRNFVLNELRNGREMTLDEKTYVLDGVLDTIIQSKNFKTLLKTNLNSLENPILTEESIIILIEELKHNIVLADKILLSARSLIFKNKSLLSFYLQSNGYFIEKVIDRINHEESLEYLYNEEVYDIIKGYYVQKYSLNLAHLDTFSRKFGPKVIRYLDNDNIHQLVNLNDEEFSKFIALFPDDKMKLSDLFNMYDSLMQYKFSKEHSEIVNIFAEIMHSLDDKNSIYIKKLEELYSVLGTKFYDKFKEVYPELVEEFQAEPKQFLLKIINQIQNKSGNSDKYIEILHFITNYYIATKREEYRSKCNIYDEPSLSIPYDLDENDLEKKLIEICLQDLYHKAIIRNKLVECGLDLELVDKCILYYLSKKDKSSKEKDVEVRVLNGTKIIFSSEETKIIKAHLRELSLISREYVKVMPNRSYYIEQLDQQRKVERVYKEPNSNPNIYQLLISMNASALKHTLANTEAYDSLFQTMNKYKLHLIPEGFKELLESEHIGISGDYSNLSGFIAYYDKIYETEKSRLESQGKNASNITLKPVNIFIYSEVYSSVSSVYSQILSSKDASLIKANPGPNQATRKTSGNDRLNEAVERTISNFTRMAVTVPTFASNVTLSSGKEIHTVVGNFSNPSNITHGERTGACMRIGGVGETLFQFCLDNENGFHIRFENPTTGEYISRVSGFRNGNTVFLNELRNSCNSEDYSDDEVVEACRIVARMLIEKSKGSSCPIENVVVHTAYAVESSKHPKTDLGVSSIKTGLPAFYSDVSSTAHILATSSETALFVPLNFDKSKVPTYLPAREKAKESTNLKELIDIINRVSGVKALLAGQPLESIEPVIVDDSFIYGIASNDWYIYIDANLEVHEDIIHVDARAKEELAVARKRVEEMLPTIEKEQAYSY